MTLEKQSPCKVNLLLNILGKRPDGFHELESVMHPIGLYDHLTFQSRGTNGIELTCSEPGLPTDRSNLVYRAAEMFLESSGTQQGVSIHLDKKIPMAAGLGGGSGNAATALLGLNELFDTPLAPAQLQRLAAALGSDVPFFLQSRPALATGRGETIKELDPFPSLRGCVFILIHPGFGIATAWAYQQLARFPSALQGRPGRAQELIKLLEAAKLNSLSTALYNSLEAPAFEKYPLLELFRDFLLENGAAGALMTGSGSCTFAIVEGRSKAEGLVEQFKTKFGISNWLAVVPA